MKICPVCKSKNVTLWMGGNVGTQYQCKECGYHGALIIEEDD